QAVFGMGAAHHDWEICFFATVALVTFLTVVFIRGWHWQVVSFATLVAISLMAYHFPKIGVEFMPALSEQTAMYMPVPVPRASVRQAADDLKIQDSLLRQFPEVESVVNKAGRADTPTDPAPLEMVETFVNFRPKELWPRRALAFDDGSQQTRLILAALEQRGYVQQASADDRDALINDAVMGALTKFDEVIRVLVLQRYHEFERELMPAMTRCIVEETMRRFRKADLLRWPAGINEQTEIDQLVEDVTPLYGPWLSRTPALED